MRARLITIFLAPLIVILLVLGGAYAWTSARSVEQGFMNQQLDDLSFFMVSARQALVSGNTTILQGEMERYGELYGGRVVVLDRSGAALVTGDSGRAEVFDPEVADEIELALSGRRAGLTRPGLPWGTGPATVVEPVTADGRVLGVVLIESSLAVPRAQITSQWLLLVAAFVAIVAASVLMVMRLARWVMRPIVRVDDAMVAIEQGEMGARIADDTGPPEMQRMIRIFNSMAGEIERVIVRQQEFAMNASHELRNPLSALLLRIEYLATGLDESWDDDVEKTRDEGQRMARILETLLTMARSERRDQTLATVELGEIARDRAAAWQQVAHDRGLAFAVTAMPGAATVTDRTALESALDAVIDNALKFAPRGTVIDVTARSADEVVGVGVGAGARGAAASRVGEATGAGVVLAVRDRGPGLTPAEIEHVTERFWRSSRDQNVAGSGLGLAIASDLLRALGGRVEVTAPAGGGLQVALVLPERVRVEVAR